MDKLNEWLSFADGWLASSAWFPWVLLMVGAWFTIYLGLPQFRFFGRAWKVLFGKTTRKEAPGDTSHFQAMSTALSGTVGTGNIGGVALALAVGGPAAIFWMWATAVVGMTTKFVEVTLSHKYREVDGKGLISGGPMYFMEKRLKMKPLAILFAIATILSALGSGNLPQSRNLAEGVEASFGIPHAVTGLVLAIALALVIVGGIKVIARVTSKIVPLMGFIYALGALAVLVTNFENVVPSFYAIFSSAFTGSAAVGGFLGASFIYACTQGVKRGLFSNEAGQGSAPIAHASARADEPVSEGLVSILEPFIDTLVICTLTAIVILSSGVWNEKFENDFHYTDTKVVVGTYHESNSEQVAALSGLFSGSGDSVQAFNGEVNVVNGRIAGNGFTVLHKRSIAEDVRVYSDDDELYSGSLTIESGKISTDFVLRGKSLLDSVPLTIEAFKRSLFGEFGQYAVSIGLVLFAFSTAIAWSYYGDRAVIYLVGDKWVTPFRIAYSIAFFLAAITDTTIVWAISAVTLALMCLPNLLGITLMSREMKQTVKEYVEREKAA